MTPPDYKLFVSPLGNVYMAELAAMLADSIGRTGRQVELRDEGLPRFEPGVVNLVVAPHEFFVLPDGPAEVDLVRSAAQSITIGMEQPGTVWFEEGARYASYGPMALDINDRGVDELRRRGLDARRLQLGYHPGWDVWQGTERGRATDLLFLGASTPRRDGFLARSAGTLSAWECDIRLFEVSRPVTTGSEHFVTGRRKYEALADSRILLNVHQGARDYFEWVRVIEAVSNGCVVVTETSAGYEPLAPSEHFVQSGLDTLADRADALLSDEDQRLEMAQRAYDYLRHRLAMVDTVDRVLGEIEGTLAGSRPGGRAPVSHHPPAGTGLIGPRRPVVPPTPPPAAPSTALSTAPADPPTAVTGGVPAVGVDPPAPMPTRRLRPGDHIETVETGANPGAVPEVTVVIPVADGAHSLRRAIDAVVASRRVRLELVVVDDHSADDSAAVARAALADLDHVAIRLVTLPVRRGAAAARNVGFELARAELVLSADVGAELFPLGLHRLVAGLAGSDAAFAYGLVEQSGPVPHLASCLPWDVARLVESDYLDAMALIRFSAWTSLGGFDERPDLDGDLATYDFWLQLADQGRHGQLVPNFVGRRRPDPAGPAPGSEAPRPRPSFADRYPRLPWGTEGPDR